MSIRDYFDDPSRRAEINGAIRRAFDRRCGRAVGSNRILLVTGDTRKRRVLARELGRAGYLVTAVWSARQAIRMREVSSFDLVLVDVAPPGGDAVRKITELRGGNDVPPIVAIATDHGCESELRSARESGAVETLRAPSGADQICAAIRRVLKPE
jgi:two-component system OmpR family response regulator